MLVDKSSLLFDHLSGDTLKVLVKPNAARTEVLDWDSSRGMLRIAVAAVPDKDKANNQLLKFLRKKMGRRCELISGARSREKVIRFDPVKAC